MQTLYKSQSNLSSIVVFMTLKSWSHEGSTTLTPTDENIISSKLDITINCVLYSLMKPSKAPTVFQPEGEYVVDLKRMCTKRNLTSRRFTTQSVAMKNNKKDQYAVCSYHDIRQAISSIWTPSSIWISRKMIKQQHKNNNNNKNKQQQ